ncbi:formimidoylglutamase [Halomonas sp. MCCC 1A11036]|uniref:Formimidoylglutamase n=2 Tax=Billgrantia zhangzhouensis TaxID=2733481 RepID=A0ABS9ABE2_9GAMM|nr:formimidoylglutamase [Halomonas zhangzhouensis]
MSVWAGREDPEPDSLRWHQVITPVKQSSPPGAALLGFASDAGVARNQGRVGAAEGPRALRKALAPLAWHRNAPVFDAGDVSCHGNDDLEAAQQRLAERVAALLSASHLPLILGGGHEVAFGSWSGLARHFGAQGEACPRIGIVNLDAHFDLRDPSHVRSSGTPFAQIAAECDRRGWPFRYACLGVSRASNTRALFTRARELNVLVREDHEIDALRLDAIVRDLQRFMARCDHLYLSIDLDVLPAAEAPGVSAPAARGVPLALIEPLLEAVRDSGKLRLADIAELNPSFDIDGHTAKAAARLIHRLTLDT